MVQWAASVVRLWIALRDAPSALLRARFGGELGSYGDSEMAPQAIDIAQTGLG
jgi:hypothetical protein